MADKNIVLEENEDLGKLRGGNDVMRLNGTTDYIQLSQNINLNIGDKVYINILLTEYPITAGKLSDAIGGINRIDVNVSPTGTLLHFADVVSTVNGIIGGVIPLGEIAVICLEMIANDKNVGVFGARYTLETFLNAQYESIKVNDVLHYIQNGDFGSPTLIDHSGNGNDGTINGATWWKTLANGEPIDAIYENATVFYATLPLTPVDFHNVIDIQTDAPPTNDPFYGLYDENWLVVTVQANAVVYILKNDSMNLNLDLNL